MKPKIIDNNGELGPVLGYVADDTVTVRPVYKTRGAVAFDIAISEHATIPRWRFKSVHTGLRFEIPEGYEVQIRSRSGLAANKGAFILNSPGTVDWDYKGELLLVVANLGLAPLRLERGDRVAQGVFCPALRAPLKEISLADMTNSERGEGRFGSTGD